MKKIILAVSLFSSSLLLTLTPSYAALAANFEAEQEASQTNFSDNTIVHASYAITNQCGDTTFC